MATGLPPSPPLTPRDWDGVYGWFLKSELSSPSVLPNRYSYSRRFKSFVLSKPTSEFVQVRSLSRRPRVRSRRLGFLKGVALEVIVFWGSSSVKDWFTFWVCPQWWIQPLKFSMNWFEISPRCLYHPPKLFPLSNSPPQLGGSLDRSDLSLNYWRMEVIV